MAAPKSEVFSSSPKRVRGWFLCAEMLPENLGSRRFFEHQKSDYIGAFNAPLKWCMSHPLGSQVIWSFFIVISPFFCPKEGTVLAGKTKQKLEKKKTQKREPSYLFLLECQNYFFFLP